MNSDDFKDDSALVYVACDVLVALAVCAAATLGMVAAFLLIELARRIA